MAEHDYGDWNPHPEYDPIPEEITNQFRQLTFAAQQGRLVLVPAVDTETRETRYVVSILISMHAGEYVCEPLAALSEAPFTEFESPAFPIRN